MPYLATYDPSKKQLVGGGAGPPASSSVASGPANGAPPPQSSAFTDFHAYLTANGDQAKSMGEKLAGPLNQQAQTASQSYDDNTRSDARYAATEAPFTDQGRKALLSQTAPQGYSEGAKSLDNYLLASGGMQPLTQLRNWAGALGPASTIPTIDAGPAGVGIPDPPRSPRPNGRDAFEHPVPNGAQGEPGSKPVKKKGMDW